MYMFFSWYDWGVELSGFHSISFHFTSFYLVWIGLVDTISTYPPPPPPPLSRRARLDGIFSLPLSRSLSLCVCVRACLHEEVCLLFFEAGSGWDSVM